MYAVKARSALQQTNGMFGLFGDLTTDSPVLVVDGRPLSMFDLQRILSTHEEWRVELRFVDPTE